MDVNIVEDLIKWANDKKKDDFRDFILFMNKIYENKFIVNMKYSTYNFTGRINKWNIFYNKRFTDFDFLILLDCYENTLILKSITMESFEKITNNKFIIIDSDNDRCELEIKEGI